MEIALLVRQVTVNDATLLAHQHALQKGISLKYPHIRCEIRSHVIAPHAFSHHIPNLVAGLLPRRVVICFTENEAFNGVMTKSPYNFHHFNIRSIQLRLNGQGIPPQPLLSNFKESGHGKQYVRAYETLYSGLDRKYRDSSLGISLSDYSGGYAFWAFSLSDAFSDVSYFGMETFNSRYNLMRH